MSECSFNIPFERPESELFESAKKAILGAGGEVKGELSAGTFSIPTMIGAVAGTYAIGGNVAKFDILQKPMFLSCDLIETSLYKYLGEQPKS